MILLEARLAFHWPLSIRSCLVEYEGWAGTQRGSRPAIWVVCCYAAICLERVHGFDEQFFYHFEEVDLCLADMNAGLFELDVIPAGVSITHLGGNPSADFQHVLRLRSVATDIGIFINILAVEVPSNIAMSS